VLVIDGKNNNDDTQKIDGKNNNEENNNEDTQKSAEEEIRPQPSDWSVKDEQSLDSEDMWREINISLTRELEKSKVRVVGTRDMRNRK
jgi:hypothetical protein